MKFLLFVCTAYFLNSCASNPKPIPELVTEQKVEEIKADMVEELSGQKVQGTGYAITYPLDWELRPKFMGTDTMAVSKHTSDTDDFFENINVVVEPVKLTGGVERYYELNLASMKSGIKNFSIISENRTKLFGGDAIDLIYTHNMAQQGAKNRAVFFFRNNIGYVITSTSLIATFEEYYGIFDEIVKSFTFE